MSGHDDVSIAGDDTVLRSVRESDRVLDAVSGRIRPSSAAFTEQDDGISVYLESVLRSLGLGAATVAESRDGEHVYGIVVTEVRTLGAGVVRAAIDPPRSAIDPAHALVRTDRTWSGSRRRRMQTAFARAASLVHTHAS